MQTSVPVRPQKSWIKSPNHDTACILATHILATVTVLYPLCRWLSSLVWLSRGEPCKLCVVRGIHQWLITACLKYMNILRNWVCWNWQDLVNWGSLPLSSLVQNYTSDSIWLHSQAPLKNWKRAWSHLQQFLYPRWTASCHREYIRMSSVHQQHIRCWVNTLWKHYKGYLALFWCSRMSANNSHLMWFKTKEIPICTTYK